MNPCPQCGHPRSYHGAAGIALGCRQCGCPVLRTDIPRAADHVPAPGSVTVANLWAKQLIEGDKIVSVELADTRYGPLKRFTVERSAEAHDAEVTRIAREKEAEQ